MSPISFEPSDVKNPRGAPYASPVPESFWLTRALLFDFDWVVQDSQNSDFSRAEYPDSTPLEALRNCFQKLRSYEIRLALTSNHRQSEVIPELAKMGLSADFDNIRCFEDVKENKPSPEMHLLSLDMLGIKPVRAAAFETSTEGVKAAKAAGIFCVSLGPEDEGANMALTSIIDVPLVRVLENIDRMKRALLLKNL